MSVNLENSAVATRLEKGSFHSSKKGNAKECSTTVQLHLFHMFEDYAQNPSN